MVVRAPAKLNLCLYLGGRRGDGLHELRSLFCPLVLSDRIVIGARGRRRRRGDLRRGRGPEPGRGRPRGAAGRGWDSPPLRVEIEKRIPVAAGLGGGSADAAAVLRLAGGGSTISPGWRRPRRRRALAARPPLGARRRGRRADRAAAGPGRVRAVMIPGEAGLDTAAVYARGGPLGLGREPAELERLAGSCGGPRRPVPRRSSTPSCSSTTSSRRRSRCGPRSPRRSAALQEAGAGRALVTGSGPTAFGLFEDVVAADAAAAALPPRYANAIVSTPQRLG